MPDYYLFWYSIDSKVTVPRDVVLGLRDVDPRVRIPKKTLPDGTLSNLNVRAALRDLLEDTLDGLRLHNGMYLLKVSDCTINDLEVAFTSIGCNQGAVRCDIDDQTSLISLEDAINRAALDMATDLISLLNKYTMKQTPYKGLMVLEKDAELKQLEFKYSDICKVKTYINDEQVAEIEKIKEMYEH